MSVWLVDEARQWPPQGIPKPPFSSTRVEITRSCPLREIFATSKGYEQQVADAARVGTAFHTVLQAFVDEGVSRERSQRMRQIQTRFQQAMAAQDKEKQQHPREQFIVRDVARVQKALHALYLASERFTTADAHPHPSQTISAPVPIVIKAQQPTVTHPRAAEIPVHSDDGLFIGRVDYAEYTQGGIVIVDYKSTMRDDVPERYYRQLAFYAALWQETFGTRPNRAILSYPFTGKTNEVLLSQELCDITLAEARRAIRELSFSQKTEDKAKPGEVCQVCTYRPWCRPFWRHQENISDEKRALEGSRFGMQGKIEALELIDHHWKLLLKWRKATAKMICPYERFPHLENAKKGQMVRLLNIRLYGQFYRPSIEVFDTSELFILL